jgi:hypothetical protein
MRVVEDREKGTRRLGVQLGHPVTGGHQYRDTMLSKKITVSKLKEDRAGCNLTEFSKEGYGSKRAVLPMMMMIFTLQIIKEWSYI